MAGTLVLDPLTLPGTIKLKKGRGYSKLNRVHIKSTNHSAKVLVVHLLILQITLFNMSHTPHGTKTYGHHLRQDHQSTESMAACTFPCQVQSQIARQDTQHKELFRILCQNTVQAVHESVILVSSGE
jgi:hypothetical protein